MTPNEYQALANRTAWKPSKEYSEFELMIVYNAMGLAGEVGELTELSGNYLPSCSMNLFEKEMGDCFWYMAALCTNLSIDFEQVMNVMPSKNFPSLSSQANVIASGKILEHIKKGVFHDHGIEASILLDHMKELASVLIGICNAISVDTRKVMETNIEKLKGVYPDGFDVEASKNRKV